MANRSALSPGFYCLAFLTVLLVSGVNAQTQTSATQAPSEAQEIHPALGRHTGAVDLYILGEPVKPKAAQDILTIAKKTKFFPEGRTVRKLANGRTIEYVPREFTPDSVSLALADGLLLYKFTVTGAPEKETPSATGESRLSQGTYYVFLQYLQGRWEAVGIDEQARVACHVMSIQVKQQIYIGQEHRVQFHKPSIELHELPSPGGLATTGWTVTHGGWEPANGGCKRTSYCGGT